MATLTTVRLSKGDAPSWGFRLQGGKDFGTPLVIQKVNGGSPAERAGLIAGDSVIRINNTDVFNLLHKEAQDVIVRAGGNFEMVIQRGGSTWKPAVVPVGALNKPSPVPVQNLSPVTKTSLTAQPGENIGAIGTGHNLSAKPFGQVNGAVNGSSNLVNKQYNTPLKLYSEDAIAETISAQSEVLSTGALGVNFKKNEKNYDATNSAVYRMLKEAEDEPTSPTNDASEPESGIVSAPNRGIAGLRHVVAPQNKSAPANPQIPPGQNICAECERLIVGVFVRIKDKNLHVECFKCSTCGSSLKNVGYYNINNKLYCDIHAKSAAIAINNPGVIEDVISKPPANQISAALSSHLLPTCSPLSPKTSGYSPTFPSTNIGGPKPFSSVSAPLSPGGSLSRAAPISPGGSLNRAAPLSPQGNFSKPALSPSYGSNSPLSSGRTSSLNTAGALFKERHTNIIWPPPQEISDAPTACPLFYPPPSKVEAEIEKKYAIKKQAEEFLEESEDNNLDETMSFCSEEICFSGRRSATECIEILSETLDTQKLVENVIKSTPHIVPPSLTIQESLTPTECCENPNSCDLKRPAHYNPNTVERQLQTKVENVVPQKWESPLIQSVRTTSPDADTFSLFQPKRAFSPLASALAVAPTAPFNTLSNAPPKPVPLPEFTEPYFPPEYPITISKPNDKEPQKTEPRLPPPKPYSPFVKALEIAPERPFTPVGSPSPKPPVKKKPLDPLDKIIDELPKPSETLDMRSALTTASDRPYTPLLPEQSDNQKNAQQNDKIDRSLLTKPLKPEELPASFQMNKKEPLPPSYYAPIVIEEAIQSEMQHSLEKSQSKETKIVEKQTIEAPQITQQVVQESYPMPSNFAPIFQGFSCSFKNKSDHAQFSVEVCTTPPVPCIPPAPISYIATVQEQPARITKETFIEETQDIQQTTKHQENVSVKVMQQQQQEQSKEVVGKNQENVPVKVEQQQQQLQQKAKEVVKATEEVTQVKPLHTSQILKKPEGLPSYQVNLQATAEADLLLMARKERAEERLAQMKLQQTQHIPEPISETVCQKKEVPQLDTSCQKPSSKPIITIQTDEVNHMATKLDFQPVPCQTFSLGSRSVTPSMVHKAPPLLPYYQDNLVPHFHRAIETNVFDPAHPEVSRSPSPHPAKEAHSRTPSPFPQAAQQIRPKSPAEGPPPNPLRTSKPLPIPQDSKVQQAKENLKSYLPEYKDQRDIVEQQRGMDFYRKDSLPNADQSQNVQIQQSRLKVDKKMCEVTEADSCVARRDVTEEIKQDHLAATCKTASESTEKSADGSTQIHKRKLVTEEYEKSHKESNIEIRTSATYTNKDSFSKVNVPTIEPPMLTSFHITNPHHVSFQKTSQQHSDKPVPEPAQVPVQPQFPESIPVPPPPPIRRVFPPGSLAPIKHVTPPSACAKSSDNVTKPNVPKTDVGAGAGRQTGGITAAPKRGKGLLNAAALPGTRVPLCGHCHGQIRGPFITALGKIWCPQHFICATSSCKRPLQDLGFVEERGQLYCEYCFEQYLAPPCSKCNGKIKGDCLKAIGKNFHPECFNCVYCGKLFGNNPFFLEDGNPYCEADWNELFTTKCFACGFPVEAGDRWVEALNNNYHSQCFNCTMCKKNLEGQSFFAKGGRPFCKNHAR